MIQGVSKFVYRVSLKDFTDSNDVNVFREKFVYITKSIFDEINLNLDQPLNLIYKKTKEEQRKSVSKILESENIIPHYIWSSLHVDIKYVKNDILDFEKLRAEDHNYKDAIFITEEDGNYYCGSEVEKMSKSKFNVVNPDQIIEQYGADTFRMYEMFLGPIDTAKPWDTNGISGVANFIRKFWRLFYDDLGNRKDALNASNNIEATQEELKILHKTIKKINQDIENLSFNTCVSTFMIGVNDLSKLKTVSKSTLLDFIKLIAPFAPHTAEILWTNLGNSTSVVEAEFPKHDEQYLVESAFNYPIQINGKHRANIEIALDSSQEDIQNVVLADERVLKFTEGKAPKKFIVVQGRIINVVV